VISAGRPHNDRPPDKAAVAGPRAANANHLPDGSNSPQPRGERLATGPARSRSPEARGSENPDLAAARAELAMLRERRQQKPVPFNDESGIDRNAPGAKSAARAGAPQNPPSDSRAGARAAMDQRRREDRRRRATRTCRTAAPAGRRAVAPRSRRGPGCAGGRRQGGTCQRLTPRGGSVSPPAG
jgi:hypothetical protein